jgi:hypothetical protein
MEPKQRFTNEDRIEISELYESIEQPKELEPQLVLEGIYHEEGKSYRTIQSKPKKVVTEEVQKVKPVYARKTFSNEDREEIGSLYESIYTPEPVIEEEYGDDKTLLNMEEWINFLEELEQYGFEIKGEFTQGRAPYAEYYKYNQYTIQVRASDCQPSRTGDLICDGFITEVYFDNERLSYRDETIPSDNIESLRKNTMKVIKELGFDVESEHLATEY